MHGICQCNGASMLTMHLGDRLHKEEDLQWLNTGFRSDSSKMNETLLLHIVKALPVFPLAETIKTTDPRPLAAVKVIDLTPLAL